MGFAAARVFSDIVQIILDYRWRVCESVFGSSVFQSSNTEVRFEILQAAKSTRCARSTNDIR
jgi:hypothetical protein